MIGKIIGAAVGSKLSEQTGKIGGPTGAVAGVVAATALKRLSLPAMLAIGAGGYAIKKYLEKQDRERTHAASPAASGRPSAKGKAQPTIPNSATV